jgi:hypothetical protein
MAAAPAFPPPGWKPVTPVLAALAGRFARSQAGRTGRAKLDLLVDAEELLTEAGAAAGPLRPTACEELELAERAGWLRIERDPRDPALLRRVRFFPGKADELHALLGVASPAEQRESLAAIFEGAMSAPVPPSHAEAWRTFCRELATAARRGDSVQPFGRHDPRETAVLLEVLPKLLAWRGESYQRFASCVLCGDSKSLERLSARIGSALHRITAGAFSTLADLGIVENPRSVMLHGPLRLELDGKWLDLGLLRGVARLAAIDFERASRVECSARRCVSVENETTLHELAKLAGGDLLIGTSFLGSGTRRLLERLPDTTEFWHFGDSDPAGFAVLADLRERAGRRVASLHMSWRAAPRPIPLSAGERQTAERLLASLHLEESEKAVLRQQLHRDDKGAFEQETLGPPALPVFPYYK